MTNPLLEKYEEIYGEKKEEEVVEEKKSEIPEDYGAAKYFSPLCGGMGNDILTLNPPKPSLTINGGSEIMDSGAFVIPAATVTNGAISMDGSYFKPDALISNGTTISSINPAPTCFAFDAPKTEVEKHFHKVLKDIADGKAIVLDIKADIDPSFTGFGGQIRYTIGIVGTYP
jgi:hypothetical protein